MSINNIVNDFIKTIKSTNEYRDLMTIKSKIEKNSILKKEVSEFNQRMAQIYTSNKSPKAIKQDILELNNEFNNLAQIPEIKAFMIASKNFSDMMLKFNKSMYKQLESELRIL